MSIFKLQTGPKTLAGKKRSSQNAIKTGVYAAKLLPGEFAGNYQTMREALIIDFEAYDAIGLTAVEEFAMTAVRKNRIIQAEAQYLAGVMQTEEARKALAEKLHGSQSFARLIPWWFLQSGDCQEKKTASTVRLALNQLEKLKAKGGQPTQQVITFSYPDLFAVVMWHQATKEETCWHVLARVTQKQQVLTCLEAFEAKLQKAYELHIQWADNAHRYQRVVDMVYAEFAMRVMSKPEMIKLTNALNRQTEHALSVLHAREQLLSASQASLTVQVADVGGSSRGVQVQVDSSHEAQTMQAGNAKAGALEEEAAKNASSDNAVPEKAMSENAALDNAKPENAKPENATPANDSQGFVNAESKKVALANATSSDGVNALEPRGDITVKKVKATKRAQEVDDCEASQASEDTPLRQGRGQEVGPTFIDP